MSEREVRPKFVPDTLLCPRCREKMRYSCHDRVGERMACDCGVACRLRQGDNHSGMLPSWDYAGGAEVTVSEREDIMRQWHAWRLSNVRCAGRGRRPAGAPAMGGRSTCGLRGEQSGAPGTRRIGSKLYIV